MSKKVLLTGGTGLIGKEITALLLDKGYEVSVLSRSKRHGERITYFEWDINKGYIEEGALDVDVIIHLAGAGIADARWTPQRKKVILDSRIKSAELIAQNLKARAGKKPIYIGASAIGIYGAQDTHPVNEEEIENNDDQFLVEVTKKWEEAHHLIKPYVESWSLIRIGIVLSTEGGALKPMLIPFKFRMGNYFGKGDQLMSWIHIRDLARMFIHVLENSLEGIYNGVAPNPVTGKNLVSQIASIKKGAFLQFGIPEFMLKLIFGEMSQAILMSTWVSAKKIQSKKFSFDYENINDALKELLK